MPFEKNEIIFVKTLLRDKHRFDVVESMKYHNVVYPHLNEYILIAKRQDVSFVAKNQKELDEILSNLPLNYHN